VKDFGIRNADCGIMNEEHGAKRIAIWKHQIPSTKYQISSNDQNSKIQTKSFRSFGFEVWNLFGICNLGFGILLMEVP
jgi:hypothetical protein